MIKMPKKIKILGHKFDVVLVDLSETDTFGNMNPSTCVIRLNQNKCESQIEETLLHEIIEAIDHNLELRLDHNQITSLSSVLYQVLKDNKIDFSDNSASMGYECIIANPINHKPTN